MPDRPETQTVSEDELESSSTGDAQVFVSFVRLCYVVLFDTLLKFGVAGSASPWKVYFMGLEKELERSRL